MVEHHIIRHVDMLASYAPPLSSDYTHAQTVVLLSQVWVGPR